MDIQDMKLLRIDKLCSRKDEKRNQTIRKQLKNYVLNVKIKQFKIKWSEYLKKRQTEYQRKQGVINQQGKKFGLTMYFKKYMLPNTASV